MKVWHRMTVAVAVSYAIALAVVVALLRYVGEGWWVTSVALYLPRVIFAVPLPFVVLALLWTRAWRWVWTQAVAALLLLFPLGGLVLPHALPAEGGAPRMRVLSYNIDSAYAGVAAVVEEIERFAPDVALLEEVASVDELRQALATQYPAIALSGQFIAASKGTILSEFDPEKLPHEGRMRSPRWVKYVIETPLGPIPFYVVHPISPRQDFHDLRGHGFRHEILSGHLFSGDSSASIQSNSTLRGFQVQAASSMFAQERGPAVLAGDTNLPGLSWFFGQYLSSFQDGFEKAGRGFGYTFPARAPWMRIDKIMATSSLVFEHFEVGQSRASDHRCVVADLRLR